MGCYTIDCFFEMDELFAQVDAVRWERRKERLLQFSAVKTNGRDIRNISAHLRKCAAFGCVADGCFNDSASIDHLLDQAQILQYARCIWRKPDASADFLQ